MVVGSRCGAPLSFGSMRRMQECVKRRVVVCRLAARKPLERLSEMDIRSALFRKEFTCQISFPHAEAFEMVSCAENSNKENKKYEKQSKNKNLYNVSMELRSTIEKCETTNIICTALRCPQLDIFFKRPLRTPQNRKHTTCCF